MGWFNNDKEIAYKRTIEVAEELLRHIFMLRADSLIEVEELKRRMTAIELICDHKELNNGRQ